MIIDSLNTDSGGEGFALSPPPKIRPCDVLNDGKINIDKIIKWLTEPYCGREATYFNFFKALQIFMAIPVTSCNCERTFSKLIIIKTKLRNTMKQKRLDGLLTTFFKEKLAYNINGDEVIETCLISTCHTLRETITEKFLDRLISLRGDQSYPFRSCHLTPCEFFL
jgi:hypothetical protein